MERSIYVSTGEGIAVFSGAGRRDVRLCGAGALLAAGDHLLCACETERAVCRLDLRTLTPCGSFPGGPGLCDLCAGTDGEAIYMLFAEADSVAKCDAHSGQALVLNRAGCNPRQMALHGDTLAVAGGESGFVHLFDAGTLEETARLPAPGPVYATAFSGGAWHALSLTQTLDAALVTFDRVGNSARMLPGMPGCLLPARGCLLAATQGRLHAFSPDGKDLLYRRDAPGRAGEMLVYGGRLLLLDAYSERVFALDAPGGMWRLLCADARAMALE